MKMIKKIILGWIALVSLVIFLPTFADAGRGDIIIFPEQFVPELTENNVTSSQNPQLLCADTEAGYALYYVVFEIPEKKKLVAAEYHHFAYNSDSFTEVRLYRQLDSSYLEQAGNGSSTVGDALTKIDININQVIIDHPDYRYYAQLIIEGNACIGSIKITYE